jgi:hypothetical protein
MAVRHVQPYPPPAAPLAPLSTLLRELSAPIVAATPAAAAAAHATAHAAVSANASDATALGVGAMGVGADSTATSTGRLLVLAAVRHRTPHTSLRLAVPLAPNQRSAPPHRWPHHHSPNVGLPPRLWWPGRLRTRCRSPRRRPRRWTARTAPHAAPRCQRPRCFVACRWRDVMRGRSGRPRWRRCVRPPLPPSPPVPVPVPVPSPSRLSSPRGSPRLYRHPVPVPAGLADVLIGGASGRLRAYRNTANVSARYTPRATDRPSLPSAVAHVSHSLIVVCAPFRSLSLPSPQGQRLGACRRIRAMECKRRAVASLAVHICACRRYSDQRR